MVVPVSLFNLSLYRVDGNAARAESGTQRAQCSRWPRGMIAAGRNTRTARRVHPLTRPDIEGEEVSDKIGPGGKNTDGYSDFEVNKIRTVNVKVDR